MKLPKNVAEARDHYTAALVSFVARAVMSPDLTADQRVAYVRFSGDVMELLAKAEKAVFPNMTVEDCPDSARGRDACTVLEDQKRLSHEVGVPEPPAGLKH